jgi:SAM-dependent methyltransferase
MSPRARVVRAASPRVLLGRGRVLLFADRDDGGTTACALEGDHAEIVLAVLEQAEPAVEREALVARVLAQAGAGPSERGAVDEAIDLLLRWGALASEEAAAGSPQERSRARGHIVVCVTGAIGAAYSPLLLDRLLSEGHEVRVAMTRAARRFVTERTLRAITHRRVATSLWRGTPSEPAPHVALARWADVVVVYPCTATTMSRIASGDCSELVSAVVTATRAPVLLAPSMNTEMLAAPAVAENLDRLRARGFFLAHPAKGAEVADAPASRVMRGGVAAPASHVARYVAWLLQHELLGPRVLTPAEWDVEHDRLARARAARDTIDDDIARELSSCPATARVLDVGTGLGGLARALAKRGHAVVATDASVRAIEHARSADQEGAVTWIVDDLTRSSLRSSFDVCIDRGCFGCIAVATRERYVERLASLVRPGGLLLLKVHRAPAHHLRAFAFSRDELISLFQLRFAAARVSESTLSFGDVLESPAWLVALRRVVD